MWFLQAGMTVEKAIVIIFSMLFTLFFIMPLHEWAHAFVAYKLGDNTAKYYGRLNINPLKHIDPLGALSMILFRFGWAVPVPIDSRNFKNPKLGSILTALAGPFSNLLVAFLAALIGNFLIFFNNIIPKNIIFYILMFIYSFVRINVGLAVFNLIPLPPLDGSSVLMALLPRQALEKYFLYRRYISFLVFLLLFSNILSEPLSFFEGIVFNEIIKLASLPFSFFG